ncbi:RNA-dependent DNA polymerase [Achlya hypogyna]|uniref:RNA-dependent DNA polymerase n=1 Tax=Achlya hypogyna TaxID=1202772 RepID=A0A1V9YIL7_ACHHY|nr:RNA-dependent DNA polymerase [Achlya hypogyna]
MSPREGIAIALLIAGRHQHGITASVASKSEPDNPGALAPESGHDANGQPRTGVRQPAEKHAAAEEIRPAKIVTAAASRDADQKNIWLLTLTYQRSCGWTAKIEPSLKSDSIRSPRFPASTIDKASAKATQQIEAPAQTQCMSTEGQEYSLETPQQARERVRERLNTKRELKSGRARTRSLDLEEKTELHRIQIATSAPDPSGTSTKRKPAAQPSYARRGSLRETMVNPSTVTPSGAPQTPPYTAPNSPATDTASQLRELEQRMQQMFDAQLSRQKASFDAYVQQQEQRHTEEMHRTTEALRTAVNRATMAQDAVERSQKETQDAINAANTARAAATAAQQAATAAQTHRPSIPTPAWGTWNAPIPPQPSPTTPAPAYTPTTAPIGPRGPDLKRFKVEKFTGAEIYPGLGCNFGRWFQTFNEAVERDVAFYGSTWTEPHCYHALKASLGSAVLLLVNTHEPAWRQASSNYGYQQLAEHLLKAYSTHMTHEALMAKLQEPKRRQHTWLEHVQFMRHVQAEVGATNQLILDIFCRHACPELSRHLITHVADRNKNDPATLDSAVAALTALTGTGSNYTRNKHNNQGRAMAAIIPNDNHQQGGGRNNGRNGGRGGGRGGRGGRNNGGGPRQNDGEMRCAACKQTGHRWAQCPLFTEFANTRGTAHAAAAQPETPAPQPAASQQPATPVTTNQVTARTLEDRINYMGLVVADDDNTAPASGTANVATTSDPSTTWLLDSGCTHHLVTDPSVLRNPVPSDLRISVANKQQTMAQLKGSLVLNLHDTGHTLTIREAHYVPDLTYNLISASELDDKGFHLSISKGRCDIFSGPRHVTTSIKKGKLWPLQCTAQHVPAVTSAVTGTPTVPEDPGVTSMLAHQPQGTLQEWHIRLGHINKQAILRMAEQAPSNQMQVTRAARDLAEPCLDCAVGKQGRSKQPRTDTSTSAPTDEIGAVISSDCVGKLSPPDRFGNRYFVNYVDHGSGYTAVYPIKKKSHQERTAMAFISMFERQFNVKVKTFRSDRGGEYRSETFQSYLAQHGITHQLTERHTSASNGKSERMHRTLLNGARAMLFGTDLPSSFWSYALKYQAYLRNRVPSKANAKYKAPIEILTGHVPPVDHVLAFGSVCTVHVPPQSKGIVRRAEVGRILGINLATKAYDVWVPRTARVITSKDIQNISAPRSPNKVFAETLTNSFQRLTIKTTHNQLAKVTEHHKAKTPALRRSDRLQHLVPAAEGDAQAMMVTTVNEPRNPSEALNGPQAKEWQTAMQSEIDNLIQNGTWELVAKPTDTNIVGHKWVYKVKFDSNGEVERFKARLVAQGFSQRYGVDFTETFSPVIRQPSVRILLVIATHLDVPVLHLDVPQAYVKADLDTTVYMSLPALIPGDPATQALLLRKSLYGLKQSGRMWHEDINATLIALGYNKSQPDPCLFYKWTSGGLTMIGLYVDDIIALTQDKLYLQSTIKALEDKYQVKTLGHVSRCLGINVHRSTSGMFLEQTALVDELLTKHKMADCHPQSTPIAVEHHLFEDGGPSDVTSSEMREIVGSLLWLASCTRPDIAFATNLMARFLNSPNEHHGRQIRRMLRYLKATRTYGLQLAPHRDRGITMDIYSDADWAGDRATRRSTSGCLIEICGAPIHWYAKQQASVALSTMEAEYVAASVATQEAIWLSQLMQELRLTDAGDPVNLWCDNQSALKSMSNQATTNRSKHIDIRYHFVREAIQAGSIVASYCQSDEMPADGLTKVLSAECLERARVQLHVYAADESKVMKELAAKVQLEGEC